MNNVYPFASGSLVTASYAVSASYASAVGNVQYVATASTAATVLNPISGSAATVNICLITYAEYLLLCASASKIEVCSF